MAEMQQFLYRVQPARLAMLTDGPTPDEELIVGEHFAYLEDLTERIDQRANVFTLGRYAICALSDRIEENWREGFQGSTELADVIEGATQADRGERYDTVRDFVEAFIQIARR